VSEMLEPDPIGLVASGGAVGGARPASGASSRQASAELSGETHGDSSRDSSREIPGEIGHQISREPLCRPATTQWNGGIVPAPGHRAGQGFSSPSADPESGPNLRDSALCGDSSGDSSREDGGEGSRELSGGSSPPVRIAAFYRFTAMADLPALRRALLGLAEAAGVRGTILLAEEGVNGTISGPEAGVQQLLARLRQCPGLEGLEARFSAAASPSFHRLKVRIRPEIVTLGCPEVQPARQVGTYVPPQQWDALIRDPDTLVLDTRNAYEVAIGSFAAAVDPGTASFREFPAWVERQLRPLVAARRPRAIAMFCTGGIRCEKGSAYLLQQGFTAVHHLQGGILRYLEEMPESGSSWRGECYVFDQRVSVTHRLQPGSHSLCHACGLPLSAADRQHAAYQEGVSCHHCLDRFSDADRQRFRERQRQMQRAARRGEQHIGATMPAD